MQMNEDANDNEGDVSISEIKRRPPSSRVKPTSPSPLKGFPATLSQFLRPRHLLPRPLPNQHRNPWLDIEESARCEGRRESRFDEKGPRKEDEEEGLKGRVQSCDLREG